MWLIMATILGLTPKSYKCPKCDGQGKYHVHGHESFPSLVKCRKCGGTGYKIKWIREKAVHIGPDTPATIDTDWFRGFH